MPGLTDFLEKTVRKTGSQDFTEKLTLAPTWLYDSALQLYLPLYDNSLQAASFKSIDQNAFTCTVIGAIWTIQGRSFDGIDDIISIPDATSLRFGTGDFTVWVWVNTTQSASGVLYPILISKYDEVTQGWQIYQTINSNKVIFEMTDDPLQVSVTSANAINDGNWHQLALVRNGNTLYAYVDMVSQGTAVCTGFNTDVAVPLDMGNRTGVADRDSSGTFGEALLYSQALTLAELTATYNATKSRYGL